MPTQITSSRTASPTSTPASPAAQRLLSLDVLRGVTVALMILVNNAGDGNVSYAQLQHSRWNGCTLTDLVFPTFLFIVGASIVLSFQVRLERGRRPTQIFLQVLRRALIILALGLLLNAMPFFHLSELRYFGVLQRIALCYLLASAIYLSGGWRAAALTAVFMLFGYWWLMTRVSVPGFGLPGISVPVLDRTGNLASWMDRLLIDPAHLYRHDVYDPEGLLSTVPAVGTTLLGVCAAAWLRTKRSAAVRAAALLLVAVLLIVVGLFWAKSFPLNKRLWTSSYVLFASGISAFAFAVLFWLIDGPIALRRGLTPWLMFGTNALTAYMVSEVLAIALAAIPANAEQNLQQWLFALLPASVGSPSMLSLSYSVLFVFVCAFPVLFLYKRRLFIKL